MLGVSIESAQKVSPLSLLRHGLIKVVVEIWRNNLFCRIRY